MRIRPFAFYGVSTCNTTEQDKLAKNGSYPSGHTSIGWATALVLAEINPQRQNEILKRGYELGEPGDLRLSLAERCRCGAHCRLRGGRYAAHQPGLPAAVAESQRRIREKAEVTSSPLHSRMRRLARLVRATKNAIDSNGRGCRPGQARAATRQHQGYRP